ncbi:MAG: hypothetical protein AB8G22_09635, partial [Saprospiraceae bacterium]
MNTTAPLSTNLVSPSEGMPLKIGTFILIFALYFFVQIPLQQLATYDTLAAFIAKYTSFKALLLISMSFMVFLGQALGVYLVCYYTYKRYPIVLTVALSLLVWLSTTSVRYLSDQVIFQWWFGIHNYTNDPSLLYYFVDNIYWGGNCCMFGVVIY